MKKIVAIIILSIFSLSLSGCITSNPKEASSDLKTYINEKYSLELQHPSNWNLYDYDQGNTNLPGITISPFMEKDLINEADTPSLNIYAYVKNPQIAKEYANNYINQLKESEPFGDVEMTEDTILLNNNIEAIRLRIGGIKLGDAYVDTKETVTGESVEIWFNYNKAFFTIKYSYPLDDHDKYNKTFEGIISSIKFID